MSLLYANFDDFSSNTMKSGSDFLSKVRPAKKEVKADLVGCELHFFSHAGGADHFAFGNRFAATHTDVGTADLFSGFLRQRIHKPFVLLTQVFVNEFIL